MAFGNLFVNIGNTHLATAPFTAVAGDTQVKNLFVNTATGFQPVKVLSAVELGSTTYAEVEALDDPTTQVITLSIADQSFCDGIVAVNQILVEWPNPEGFFTHLDYSLNGTLLDSVDLDAANSSHTFTTRQSGAIPGHTATVTGNFFNVVGTGPTCAPVSSSPTFFTC